jgi:DNA-binding transcriptional LysR family regulator
MDMIMELRHLRYFIAVAEEGHVTRAALRLGIQQPPLSQQIKALERELDVQLLRRKARGIELTEAGRVYFESARAILGQLGHAAETSRRTARGEQGRICIGITPTSPFHPFLPRVIRAFRDTYPQVSVRLEEQLGSELLEQLRNDKIDAAFIRTPVVDPEGLTVIRLLEEPLLLALPRNHPLAGRQALRLRDLVRETFIVYGPISRGFHDLTMMSCNAAGFSPRVGQEASRVTSLLALVATGAGITIVPASLQQMHIDGVLYRPLEDRTQLKAVLNLVSRRGDPSAVVRRFLNLVRQAAKGFVLDDPKPAARLSQKRKSSNA